MSLIRVFRFLALAGINMIFAMCGIAAAITEAPRNYSQYVNVVFQENMTGWDFVKNVSTFYQMFIPVEFWYLYLILLPFLSMYIRQNSTALALIVCLVSGGVIFQAATILGSKLLFILLVLSIAGSFYGIFFRE